MEAKVDVRKLQVLNDRINQTIDALNQVRLSVHGLGHTGGFMSQGFPQTQWGGQFPQSQFGQQGMQGLTGGLGHTGVVPPQLNPLSYLTQGQGFGSGIGQFGGGGFGSGIGGGPVGGGGFGLQHSNPYMNPLVNPQVLQQLGGQGVWGGGVGTESPFQSGPYGIEQKLIEARASDPYRISQTFPFAVI